MKLTPEERDQLRQRFLLDVDVNLDRLIVITEQAMSKKYDNEIENAKAQILSMIHDDSMKKEVENLINSKFLPQASKKQVLTQ